MITPSKAAIELFIADGIATAKQCETGANLEGTLAGFELARELLRSPSQLQRAIATQMAEQLRLRQLMFDNRDEEERVDAYWHQRHLVATLKIVWELVRMEHYITRGEHIGEGSWNLRLATMYRDCHSRLVALN